MPTAVSRITNRNRRREDLWGAGSGISDLLKRILGKPFSFSSGQPLRSRECPENTSAHEEIITLHLQTEKWKFHCSKCRTYVIQMMSSCLFAEQDDKGILFDWTLTWFRTCINLDRELLYREDFMEENLISEIVKKDGILSALSFAPEIRLPENR